MVASLQFNTVGADNTANGQYTLVFNTTGNHNTAAGSYALYRNTTGSDNAAIGFQALWDNTTGSGNTALGQFALNHNIGGSGNIGIGQFAGLNLTGGNNIDIGNLGKKHESNTIRIGTNVLHENTYVAGISGVTVPGGVGVIVDGSGHLGTVNSSARYKDNIKPMSDASEAILSLKPVTFRYKKELGPEAIPQFGLVAEEVESRSRPGRTR